MIDLPKNSDHNFYFFFFLKDFKSEFFLGGREKKWILITVFWKNNASVQLLKYSKEKRLGTLIKK